MFQDSKSGRNADKHKRSHDDGKTNSYNSKRPHVDPDRYHHIHLSYITFWINVHVKVTSFRVEWIIDIYDCFQELFVQYSLAIKTALYLDWSTIKTTLYLDWSTIKTALYLDWSTIKTTLYFD